MNINDLYGNCNTCKSADLYELFYGANNVTVADIEDFLFDDKSNNTIGLNTSDNLILEKANKTICLDVSANVIIEDTKPIIHKQTILEMICEEPNDKIIEKGLSIIITAYSTADYILQTLDSIYSQDWISLNSCFEVLIGIDGCLKTKEKVQEIMGNYKNLRAFFMPLNNGTFPTSNTLVKFSKYSRILRFDSDDFFTSNLSLTKIMSYDKPIVRFYYTDYKSEQNKKIVRAFAYGSVLYSREVFDLAGGYLNWLCSGDFEFYKRVSSLFDVADIAEPIYYHRLRPDSLMSSKKTSMSSEYRKKVNAIVNSYNYKKGDDININPIYNEGYEIFNKKDHLIVTMTSWTKRINNVELVLLTILNNTCLPDMIVVNLAISEFPNKEKGLPDKLNELISNNDFIYINWLVNNTYVWKKSIPTLVKYPESYCLCIDDDFSYPKDFILAFKDAHKKFPNKPITGVISKNHGYNLHCGCSSLDNIKWMEPYIYQLDESVYDTGDEDTTFTYLYMLNNNNMEYCGKKFHTNMRSLNSNNGYSKEHHINVGGTWDVLNKKFKK